MNFSLHVDSLLEVSEFRKSCIRHNWPPDGDALDSLEIDIEKLRTQVQNMPPMEIPVAEVVPMKKKKPKEEERPQWSDDFRLDRKSKLEKEKDDRPASPASVTSENAEMTSSTTSSSSDTQKQPAAAVSTPSKKQATPKAVSAAKKSAAKKVPASPRKEPPKAKVVQKSSSSHSIESDRSADDQPAESAMRTVTPVSKSDGKPCISITKEKTKEEKSPGGLRKEATRIIKKAEPEDPEEEENGDKEPEKIDSSTRPVTPTLENEPVVDDTNLASQVTEAFEAIQIEDMEKDEDEVDGTVEDVPQEPRKQALASKGKISSPRKIPKPVVKVKKVSK